MFKLFVNSLVNKDTVAAVVISPTSGEAGWT